MTITQLLVVDTVANLSTASAHLVDGQNTRTLGYHSIGDGGGQDFVYHKTGRPASPDGGFTIAGGGADDYFEATNQSVARALQFGAKGDGVTNDRLAIQAAIDTQTRIVLDSGRTYAIDDTLTVSNAGQQIDGRGAALKAIAPMTELIALTGSKTSVEGLEIDGNGGSVILAGQDGRGMRLSGNGSQAVNCYVHDLSPGTKANGIFTSGKRVTITRCRIENAGYAGLRLDAEINTVRDCDISYTTTRSGYSYRWVVSNSGSGKKRIDIQGGRWFSDQAVETVAVLDIQPIAETEDRHVTIRNLYMDHSNYTAGANDQCFKFEGWREINLENIQSNVEAGIFCRISGANVSKLQIDRSRFLGRVHTSSRPMELVSIDHCEMLGGTTSWLQGVEYVKLIRIANTQISGFTGIVTNNAPHQVDQRIQVENVDLVFDHSVNAHLFSGIGLDSVDHVSLRNFRITTEGTGKVYLSNTIQGRLYATGDENTLWYDHLKEDIYRDETGHVGVRTTAQTHGYSQIQAATSGDAFPTINGRAGQMILNRNPANGLGQGWVHDGTQWNPL